jgi:hypothetical protein
MFAARLIKFFFIANFFIGLTAVLSLPNGKWSNQFDPELFQSQAFFPAEDPLYLLHDRRIEQSPQHSGTGVLSAAHILVRGSHGSKVLFTRGGFGVMGFSEKAA